MKFVRKFLALFFCWTFFSGLLVAQIKHNTAPKYEIETAHKSILDAQFKSYKIVKLSTDKYLRELKEFKTIIDLDLQVDENETWSLQLIPQYDLVADMKIVTASKQRVDAKSLDIYPYYGFVKDKAESHVAITVSPNAIYAYSKIKNKHRFIEPLWYLVPGVPKDLHVVYDGKDVIFPEGNFCGSSHMHQRKQSVDQAVSQERSSTTNCLEVEFATASDYSMYTKYNSSTADVIAHNTGVMNNVQMNYDDEFADQLNLVNVEQYVIDCDGCDPWTSSTQAETLLMSFRDWGQGANSFSSTYDFAQLWTNRDFNGGTIGIAYVGVICGYSRYQALQDFSSNANFKRVMVAHETGHNFSATHDASGAPHIMAPTVQNTSTWSEQSINQIQTHYNGKSCLAACPPPEPPNPEFAADVTNICPETTVQFLDKSTGNPTGWNWTFSGGEPASSTDQNPVVTYNNPGVYSVTLEATNDNGSNVLTKTNYIEVNEDGISYVLNDDFSDVSNWSVSNPDNSITWGIATAEGSTGNSMVAFMNNADYSTGNGQFDGLVSKVLDLTGRSNTKLKFEYAYARHSASNSDKLRVKISTDGGNTFPNTIFLGEENGSGSFATAPDQTSTFLPSSSSEWCVATTYGPSCVELDLSDYDGNSNVRINFENESGFGNNLFIDRVQVYSSCVVIIPPEANFSADIQSACAVFDVQYQDQSLNDPTSWFWSFPGGSPETSTEQNPIVTYSTAGTYDATLVATNDAGSSTRTYENFIVVDASPTPNFSSTQNGPAVTFQNQSTNANTYQWDFGDGSMSSLENPVHLYDTNGTYTVTLKATNDCGTESIQKTIVIANPPSGTLTADVVSGCAPLTVQFGVSNPANVDSYQWEFVGGEPSSSTLQNPQVSYTSRGSYQVKLTLINSNGTTEIVEPNFITVQDKPELSFTYLPNDLLVQFNNTSEYADTYLWNFGDGDTSTMVNPSHTYSGDGTYTVSLTGTNSCGTTTITKEVVISNLPVAGFSASAIEGCAPLTVNYTDQSSANTSSWSWFFEGGNPSTSTDKNPSVTYSTAGTYDVQLIAINSEGADTLFKQNYITVRDLPSGNITHTASGNIFSFKSNAMGADSTIWDFGDGGTSILENPTYTYQNEGTYLVKLRVVNPCGSAEYSTEILYYKDVEASISADLQSGCTPLTVNFQSTTANATTWSWKFPGGTPSSSNQKNPKVVYDMAGDYDVELIVSNPLYSDTMKWSEYINVSDEPVVDFAYSYDGLKVDFTNLTADADSYSWKFGDGGTSTEENPSHTYADYGAYVVELTASNTCGSSVDTLTVLLSQEPNANFTSDYELDCGSQDVQFKDISDGSPISWSWTFEGGTPATSSVQDPKVSYSEPGSYDVQLIVQNAFGQDTIKLEDYIVIKEKPVAAFDFSLSGTTVSFTNQSGVFDSYYWDFGDSATSQEENPTHDYGSSGDYDVLFAVDNGGMCTDTIRKEIEIIVDVVSTPEIVDWRIYPNPTSGVFTIDYGSLAGKEVSLQVYNTLGQSLLNEHFKVSQDALQQVYENNWSTGLYYIQLQLDGVLYTKKLVISY